MRRFMPRTLRARGRRVVGRDDDSPSSSRRIYPGRVPGHWELVVLAVVLLLLFGSKQVPQIARQLGRGVREVKQTVADVDVRHDVHRAFEAPEDEARAGDTDPRSDA
jgi:TatA/E family protein of Tat protein translocase